MSGTGFNNDGIFINGKKINVDEDRLKYNNSELLAYKSEIDTVTNTVNDISSVTTNLSADKDLIYTSVYQSGHGFDVLDAVYYDPHDDMGAFTNDEVVGFQDNRKEAIRTDVVGKEPEFSYDSSNSRYNISCWGGCWEWDNEGNVYFLNKNGGGDGDLQCIMNVDVGSPRYNGCSGLRIHSDTGQFVEFGFTKGLQGFTYVTAYSYDSLNDPSGYDGLGVYLNEISNDTWKNTRIKLQVDGTRIRLYYQRIGTDPDFVELDSTSAKLDFPPGSWDNYNVGFMVAGGAYSSGTYYQASGTIEEIDGSLSTSSGDNSTWELAGGHLEGNEAEGIVIEVPDENNFKVATSGIIKVDGSFTKSSTAYLSQTNPGDQSYSIPTGRVQKLWKGLSSDEAQLILNKSPNGSISYVDENGVSSLLPEVTGQSGLGTSSYPWGNVYANDVILDGSSLSTRQTNLENTVSADIASISASVGAFSATLSGSALSYNIEGSTSSLNSDQIVSFSTVDYEFDEEGLESGGQYTVQVDGVYKFECDMTAIVSAGSITNSGLRINSSFVTGFSTGVIGGSDPNTIRKTRILQLSIGDTIDWYHDDNTSGGTTYSGWWCIYKL